jgi:hypothetical protein
MNKNFVLLWLLCPRWLGLTKAAATIICFEITMRPKTHSTTTDTACEKRRIFVCLTFVFQEDRLWKIRVTQNRPQDMRLFTKFFWTYVNHSETKIKLTCRNRFGSSSCKPLFCVKITHWWSGETFWFHQFGILIVMLRLAVCQGRLRASHTKTPKIACRKHFTKNLYSNGLAF